MAARIVNYNPLGKAWKGGCVPSRPVDFPTTYFKTYRVEFINWDDLNDFSEKDILLVEWDIFLLENFNIFSFSGRYVSISENLLI